MKVSLKWLKEYVDITLAPDKLAEELTMSAIEVEKIENLKKDLDKVVVGKVLAVSKHPNADKLFVAEIDVGSKKIQLVFGTLFKVQTGELLPIALPGAGLLSGIKIKKTKFRGVESHGMFATDKELGITYSEEGLIRFPSGMKPGTPLTKALNLDDVVLNLDVLANRGDCMSHRGVAREIGALTGKKLKDEKYKLPVASKGTKPLKVSIKNKKLCPRYSAIVVSGIEIRESPDWLKSKLIAVGFRPINNIVDLTNYIMMDVGQPLHAFDLDKISGATMIVRTAKKGEQITTLDGVERKLGDEMLIIEDKDRLIDLAGIMGGENSEISKESKSIVLQAAVFDPLNLRKTARLLRHRTDALAAFEKGVDQTMNLDSLAKTFGVLKELCPKVKLLQVIDIQNVKDKPKRIKISIDEINHLLGLEIPESKITTILKSLDFKVKRMAGGTLEVTVPSFRSDVNIPEDVAEEVVRIFGYDHVPETLTHFADRPPRVNKEVSLERQIKNILQFSGCHEVNNYSFVSKKILSKIGLKINDHIRVVNPLSDDQEYLRTELTSGLLTNAALNLKNFLDFKLFEVGKVYFPMPGAIPCESIVISGMIVSGAKSKEPIFYDAKGLAEHLLRELNVDYRITPMSDVDPASCAYWNCFHPGRSAEIKVGDKMLGSITEINPETLAAFRVKARVGIFSMSLKTLEEQANTRKYFTPLPKYPPSYLDLAFVLKNEIFVADVLDTIKSEGKLHLSSVELFDVYHGKPLSSDQKSVAFHLTFQDPKRTLKEREVDKLKNNIVAKITSKYQAKLREF